MKLNNIQHAYSAALVKKLISYIISIFLNKTKGDYHDKINRYNSKRNLMVGAAAVAALGVINPVIAATDPHAAHKPAPAAVMLAKVALENL